MAGVHSTVNRPTSSPAVTPFDALAATADEWARFHAYRRIRHQERSPDEPLTSDEVVEANMKKPSATWVAHRFQVETDDRIVGYVELESPIPDTPEYPSNRHLVYAGPSVIGPYRHRGIGTALLRQCLQELDARQARILTSWSSEPDGQAFAERVGAKATQTERVSRLDVREVDWDQTRRWVADLETRAPGTRLQLFERRLPEDFLEEYCPARTRLMNLMPWDDTDHGDIVVTPDDFRELNERLDLSHKEHHTIIAREPDGTISAITDVAWERDHPDELEQWFTGVDPAYRGRGLGKAIKAAMLEYCRDRYPDLRWVRTGNATTNASMLAINERLGFEEYKRYTVYQIERDALAAYIAARS